jgi:hypothetical protein
MQALDSARYRRVSLKLPAAVTESARSMTSAAGNFPANRYPKKPG